MNSIIELIEYNFGASLNTNLIKSLKSDLRFDEDAVEGFYSILNDYTHTPYIPRRENSEIRALVGYSHSDKDMIFYDVDDNKIDIDYFKRLLLYYDRVVLTIHTEFFYEKMFDRGAIFDLMRLLIRIKPLVEKNIINFVAEPVLYNTDDSFKDNYKLITGVELGESIDYFKDPSRRAKKKKFELNPTILADLNACHSLDLDYVTTLPGNWSQVKNLFLYSSKDEMEKATRHLWATSLLNFDLPNLTNLTYKDIISIRENHQAFDEWRGTLNELFDLLAKNKPTDVDAISKEVQYFSKHRIQEKRRKLEEEIKNSTLKEHLKNNFLVITISFLGQLLASNFLDIPLTKQLITLMTGSSGIASSISYIQKAKSKKKNYLLAKYYSLLEESA